MARTSVDVTYATQDGSAPRTPGRPVVHAPNDYNRAQPQASMVAMRIDAIDPKPIKGRDGDEYIHVKAYYLHAQETAEKEPQPYASLTNRPAYNKDGGRVVDSQTKQNQYTNDILMPYQYFTAMASAARHAQENEPTRPDIRRKMTKNDKEYVRLYVQAPLEFTRDGLAPKGPDGKRPPYLRPIGYRARPIDKSIIPDERFWTKDQEGKDVLNLNAVDEYQEERSLELEPERKLIREGRGGEVVSKLTGKPFSAAKAQSAPGASAASFDNESLFGDIDLEDYESPAEDVHQEAPAAQQSRDDFADSLSNGSSAAQVQGPENEAPSI